jgi:ATP diphosphatase
MSDAQNEQKAAAPRPLESFPTCGDARSDALRRVLHIVDRLREPDGCPWDREQTLKSLAPSLIEEAHELVEAIEREDDGGALEEAGDVVLVVALLCRIASEAGRFDLARAAEALGDKLVRRHPHVFGDAHADSSASAIANWERIKQGERRAKAGDASALAGVPRALPALQRAQRLGSKAIAAGFKWTDARGALAKLREEQGELEQALAAVPDKARAQAAPQVEGALSVAPELVRERALARAEEELGDLLFAAAQLANYAGLDAERAARGALLRFERRFRSMEQELGELRGRELPELQAAWERAKARVAAEPLGSSSLR